LQQIAIRFCSDKRGNRSDRRQINQLFRRIAEHTALLVGTPWAFILAAAVIIAWGASGPLFDYSDTWQLVVNTGTTIITFLIVFLIQNTQNRESRIMRLKLDELLRGVEGARTGFVSLDKMTDKELDEIEKEFERLRVRYAPLIEDDLAAVRAERAMRQSRIRQRRQ
jgi:low affinity Fe/Cu permease